MSSNNYDSILDSGHNIAEETAQLKAELDRMAKWKGYSGWVGVFCLGLGALGACILVYWCLRSYQQCSGYFIDIEIDIYCRRHWGEAMICTGLVSFLLLSAINFGMLINPAFKVRNYTAGMPLERILSISAGAWKNISTLLIITMLTTTTLLAYGFYTINQTEIPDGTPSLDNLPDRTVESRAVQDSINMAIAIEQERQAQIEQERLLRTEDSLRNH